MLLCLLLVISMLAQGSQPQPALHMEATQIVRDAIEAATKEIDAGLNLKAISLGVEWLSKTDLDAAVAAIKNALAVLFKRYEGADEKERTAIRSRIVGLLKDVAKFAPAIASAERERFAALRKALGEQPGDTELLDLAMNAVDADLAEAVALAEQSLRATRLPMEFAGVLVQIENKDPQAAFTLAQKALARIDGPHGLHAAFILGAYVNQETMVALPFQSDGQLVVPLPTRTGTPDGRLRAAYVTRLNAFLATLTVDAGVTQLAWAYNLASRMVGYAKRAGVGREPWEAARTRLYTLAQAAGASADSLQRWRLQAEYLVEQGTIGDPQGIEKQLQTLTETKDASGPEREKAILNLIWTLAQQGRFVEAEDAIRLLKDTRQREQQSDLVRFHRALKSVSDGRWVDLETDLRTIAAPPVRFIILVAATREARKSRPDLALDFLTRALRERERVEAEGLALAGQFCLIESRFGLDDQGAFGDLALLLAHLNAKQVERAFLGYTTPDKTTHYWADLKPTLESCLRRAARIDWRATADLARSMDGSLQALGLVIVATEAKAPVKPE